MTERPRANDSGDTGNSGSAKVIVAVIVAVMVCAAAGLGVYFTVLAPRLKAATSQAAETSGTDAIPKNAGYVDLPEAQAAAVAVEPNEKTSVLTYSVSIICENAETKALVEKNQQLFVAMFSDLHRNKTKKDLDDPEFQQNLLKQALEEGNSLLRRLQSKPNPEIKIFQVLYLKYAVFTMP